MMLLQMDGGAQVKKEWKTSSKEDNRARLSRQSGLDLTATIPRRWSYFWASMTERQDRLGFPSVIQIAGSFIISSGSPKFERVSINNIEVQHVTFLHND